MTTNPFLRTLLRESGENPDGSQPPYPPDESAGGQESAGTPPPPPAKAAPKQPPQVDKSVAPKVQSLLRLWKQGEHLGVASELMYTEANYADFVDLVFLLGHEQARELGGLLDELADTQGMKPPETPPEYDELINRVASADGENKTL